MICIHKMMCSHFHCDILFVHTFYYIMNISYAHTRFSIVHITNICNYFPHSPYENRCPFLHDPRAKLDGEENNRTIVVPVKTKMHNGDAVVDRLYHHKNVSVLQTNPIISPHTWEKCRPSGSDDDSKAFEDTYNLICNVQKAADSVLPSSGRRLTGCGPVLSYKDRVVMNSSSIHDTVLDELRKLCIVLLFHDTDEIELAGEEETRFDYTYEPKDCEFMFMIMMIVHILSSLSRFYIVCDDLPSSFISLSYRHPRAAVQGSSYRILPTIGHCEHRAAIRIQE